MNNHFQWGFSLEMEDFFDYEAGIFALGGDVSCPSCEIGVLILSGEEEDTLMCDICDSVFEIEGD